jgi:hypothetical protein
VTAILALTACGGSDPAPQPGSGTGNVALFFTDNISFYQQVVTTVTSVRIVNTAADRDCMLLDAPVTLDIANLTDTAQYVDMAACPDGNYNRIDISFRKAVHLMDQLGVPSACMFTSFVDGTGGTQPLSCNPVTGVCTVSIRGGERNVPVTVTEDRQNTLGVDFNLKAFTVTDFGDPAACAVTMSSAVVMPTDFNASGRAHSVTGGISDLDDAGKTFLLTVRGVPLTVDYSAANPALQPNVDRLLLFAQASGLPVNVLTGGIDLEAGSIAANRLFVKAAGTVSDLEGAPDWKFRLGLAPGADIDVSFKPPADVQGTMADGVWVNVKFDGYSTAQDTCLAATIEVLPADMIMED